MQTVLTNLFGFMFPRRSPIRDPDALANFMDEQAAFVVQKGMYEYSRARAGHYAKVLFNERAFLDAVEASSWRAYPLGLAMVTELVEGILRSNKPNEQVTVQRAISGLALYVFDRYPTPPRMSQEIWRGLRSELVTQLERIALHPPKRAIDVPEQFVKAYFKLMPIHKSLRDSDYLAIKNYLRITMCNIHDELTKRIDAFTVGDLLRSRGS